MTKETIKDIIYFSRNEGGVYCPEFSSNPIWLLKEVICTCLTNNPKLETLFTFCSPEIKLNILKMFWMDDFNYLGTRIKIISVDEKLIGSDILFTADEKGEDPIGCIEMVNRIK